MNLNEAILQKMLNDPKLLKEIEKMVSQTKIKEHKKKKESQLGQATYVNRVSQTCRLCGSLEIIFKRMDWDSLEKLYRSGCHSSENLWPLLPLHEVRYKAITCNHCRSALHHLSKETLIEKLIVQAEKIV